MSSKEWDPILADIIIEPENLKTVAALKLVCDCVLHVLFKSAHCDEGTGLLPVVAALAGSDRRTTSMDTLKILYREKQRVVLASVTEMAPSELKVSDFLVF